MSGAHVPEVLREKLLPRRALAGTARPQAAAKVERWIQKTYPSKPYKHLEKTHAEIFASGLRTKTDDDLKPARAAAHELLSGFTIAKLASPSLEVLAVSERMIRQMSSEASLAPAVAAARGLPDAIAMVARAARLTTSSKGGYTNDIIVVATGRREYWGGSPCLPLRHLVCAAPANEYAEAVKAAEALRTAGDLADRCLLAYAFPDEPWGTLDLTTALDDGVPQAKDVPAWALLSATTDAAVVRRWADKSPFHISTFALDLACALPPADAVAIFAETLPKLLVKPSYGPLHKTPPRAIVQALACIDLPEVARVLAPYASHAVLGTGVLAYFRDHAEHGAALEAVASGKTKLAATASRVLGKRADADAAPIATPKDTPPVLRDAPWRAAPGKKAAREIVHRLELLGLDLERVELVSEPRDHVLIHEIRDMTKEELAEWRLEVAAGDYARADHDYARCTGGTGWEYRRVPDADGLKAWNEHPSTVVFGNALAWAKRHGLAAIPGFVKRDWIRWLTYDGHEEMLDAVRSLVSPRIAPQLARVAGRRKHYRKIATAWLVEHAEIAAYGLVPDALGEAREPRADARAALLSLARHGKDEVIRKVAKKYGAPAERAIVALLDADPLAIGVAVPKRPDFLRLGELPQVRLRSGGALDDAALSALVEMLQITDAFDPYPGLALVREACDPASLGELAIELLEQWVIGDAPGRHEWMLFAVVHFPSERGTRRVAELAREWARKNGAKAERACAALAADGTDLALMHLGHIAETTRFAALRTHASDLLQEAAGARGMTEDELGDCTVPDAGLGSDGTVTLSFGDRDFVVSVDPSLRLAVRERTDQGLAPAAKTLPRPAKTDDPAKAKAARVRFDELKKDLESAAQRQIRRLERAMVDGRAWTLPDFEARIAKHALLAPVARALVWEIVSPEAKSEPRTFRVAEDGTRADARDREIVLPASASVRLAHPARSSELAAAWSPLFLDYEIVQPFEQLGRIVHAATAAERRAMKLERAAGHGAPARKVLGTMESRGWRRDGAGEIAAWLRSFRGASGEALTARWPLHPPISIELLSSAPDITTGALVLESDDGKHVALGKLDAVGFSEIVRDVDAMKLLSGRG